MGDEVQPQFEIIREERLFSRYVTVNNRTVRYPSGKQVDFDVFVSSSNRFVTVLPYHSHSKKFELIREYCQGINSMAMSVACGRYEPKKHTSVLHAAECELSEECRLTGGTWIKLIPDDHPGVMEGKWAATRFTPFLVIDPKVDSAPLDRDVEEYIEQKQVPLDELRALAYGGHMHLPSSQTIFMALKYLEENSLL